MSLIIEDGVLKQHIPDGQDVRIPAEVTEIAAGAFRRSEQVERIRLPDVIAIPSGEFWCCKALRFIEIFRGDVSVTVDLQRVYYLGQVIAFLSLSDLAEKEEAFLRYYRGSLELPLSVFLALAYDSAPGKAFLRRECAEVIRYLIDVGDAQALPAVLALSCPDRAVTAELVEYAIASARLEMQLTLSNYQYANFGGTAEELNL